MLRNSWSYFKFLWTLTFPKFQTLEKLIFKLHLFTFIDMLIKKTPKISFILLP